jgi:hypothetical protein
MARYTVCAPAVGLITSNILWNDADHAAATGAPCVSPFKPATPDHCEWVRTYRKAADGLRISGVTAFGRVAA